MLTTALGPIVILSAWNVVQDRVKEFFIALLFLQTAMIGTFAALDLVLFYVFYEAILIPMYLLIGVWGSENRIYAAVKFFVYTFAASVLMLVAILYVWMNDGKSFDYVVARNAPSGHPGGGRAPLRGLRAGLRGQGADVPAPHLAARRPHRGPHGRVGDPGRRAPQDGHLRLLPLRACRSSPRRRCIPRRHRRGGHLRHRLRRADVLRAEGHEAAGRLLVGLPPRLRHAGDDGHHRRGADRLGLPDAEPRRLHRRPLPPRRHALRAPPHPAHLRLRRPRQAGALDRHRSSWW